jgi:hypothetical protein
VGVIRLIVGALVFGFALPWVIDATYSRGGRNNLAFAAFLAILGFAAAVPIGLVLLPFRRTRALGVVVAAVALAVLVGVVIQLELWS